MKNKHIVYLCIFIGIIHTQTTCMLRFVNTDKSAGLSQTAYLQQRQFRTKAFYPKIRSSQKKIKTLKNRFPNKIAQRLLAFERERFRDAYSIQPKKNAPNENLEIYANHPITTSVKA